MPAEPSASVQLSVESSARLQRNTRSHAMPACQWLVAVAAWLAGTAAWPASIRRY